ALRPHVNAQLFGFIAVLDCVPDEVLEELSKMTWPDKYEWEGIPRHRRTALFNLIREICEHLVENGFAAGSFDGFVCRGADPGVCQQVGEQRTHPLGAPDDVRQKL